ncbi:MAG: permease [Cyanobacteriota bacterium ELA615]|jgi:hypothetical protein
MSQLQDAFSLFLSLLVEALPFLLLGVIFSSALLVLIKEDQLLKHFPTNPIAGALLGSFIGFLMPVCECGNVPVARRLLIKGVPPAVTVGFLLAAPTVNPIVIWSTWTAFKDQPEIVIFRVLFSLLIATIVASIFSTQKDISVLLSPLLSRKIAYSKKTVTAKYSTDSFLQSGTFLLSTPGNPIKLDSEAITLVPSRWDTFVDNLTQELRELGGMLVLGSAIAACIQVFVPRDIILHLGSGVLTSIISMMILGSIVSICSTVDAFFALSFASTFTTSSLIAFLVIGPMVDLKSISLLLSVFKPRIIFYMLGLAVQLTFILAICHSFFF